MCVRFPNRGTAPLNSPAPKPRPLSLNPRAASPPPARPPQDFQAHQVQIGHSTRLGGVATPLNQSLIQFDNTLEQGFKTAKPPLTEAQKQNLRDALQEINTLIKAGLSSPQNRMVFKGKLNALAFQMQELGVFKGPIKQSFQVLVRAGAEEMGQATGSQFSVSQYRNQPAGIHYPDPLSPTQHGAYQDAQDLLRWSANLPIPDGPLTGEKLFLMGLRDEVARLLFEQVLPPMNPQNPTPTVTEDEQILINTAGLIDDIMQGGEAIPANLLSDLATLVEKAREQGGKGLADAFEGLNDLGSQASDAADSINDATANLSSLIDNITDNLSAPNAVTPTANVVNAYIAASAAASASLPTLPFPLTMPIPLNIPTGSGGNLLIPAGSTLSYNPATGHVLNTNGLILNNGSTNITSGSSTIVLGSTVDQLNISSLNINDSGTQINATNADIQVNKVTNTSQISADTLDVNLSSGAVSMTNAQIVQGPNALLVGANDFNYAGTDGTEFSAGQVNFAQVVDPTTGDILTGGQLQDIDGSFSDGTLIQADQLSFSLNDSATGPDLLQMSGQNISVQSGDNHIDMGQAQLNLQSNPDGSSVTSFATTDASWVNGEQTITSSGAGFLINQDASGNITDISALAADLNYSNGADTVNITNGALNLSYDEGGQLSQINTQLGQVDWANGDNWASATGVDAQADFDPSGQLTQLQASAGQVQYGNESGTLQVDGGALTLNYDESGQFSDGIFSGDAISYTGTNAAGEPLNLNVGDFNGQLTANADGGQTLDVTANNLNATLNETDIQVDSIENFQVVTNGDGNVESLNLSAPGATSVQTEELEASLKNLNIEYKDEVLKASVDSLQGSVNQTDLTGQFSANGIQLWDTDTYTSLSLDSASADFEKLGEAYGLNVENVNLVLNKNDLGELTGGELSFAQLEGKIKEYTITGTNADGNQMLLSFGMSEDGEWMEKLALEIPEGGELSVQKGEDWFLKLGEQQQFAMTFDQEANTFTFNASNLNAQYVTFDKKGNQDIVVDIGGLNGNPANLQISVTEEGGIVIDDISNLSGKITVNGMKDLGPVEIDIDKIKGYSTNNLTMETTNNGMMLHLRPDGPDSEITAEVRTSYKGIPLGIEFDKVHELSAGFELETNRAQVYIGDPSGRGNIAIKAGPLKLEGSEIQVEAKYHMYDEQRMLNALDKLASDNGINVLGDYVVLDPVKGKLTLDTGNKRGPYLQTHFMFTSPLRAAMNAATPNWEVPWGIRDDAFGFTVGTGARWTHGNNENQLGLDVGLLPGSYVSLDVQKGQASLAGIPLPDYMTLGTTPYAGINFKQRGDEHRLSIQVGAFANPAGLAPDNPIIYEDKGVTWGATAGVKYQRGNVFVGAQYIGTGSDWQNFASSGENGWNHGVKGMVGFQF